MMNRSVLQSSPVQQMIMAGNSNNWLKMRPPAPSPFFSTTPSNFLTPYPTSSLPLPSWHDNQELPESWSQLLMSGVVCEEDKASICEEVDESKKMENWEEQMKQESSVNSYVYGHGHGHGNEEFHTAVKPWSQIVPAASSSSINSCATSFSSSSNSMLDISNNNTDTRPPSSSDPSSECNSVAGGGALKKARVQSSTTQSTTFKVRKEKLGDRITALHQLVSPFGKTDTASVLLEAIGYIRFLQSQIQTLSLPYLGSGSGSMRHQQSVQEGDKSCIFPEDPGQECKEEEKKELRSRGLCLVPVSCTLQVGNDNGADYWAPAFGGGFR